MAPRSTHRTAVLTVTGLMVTALMYSAAYYEQPAHAQHATATPTNSPTNTPTRAPTSTATVMPSVAATGTATATLTATTTATPLSTATNTPTVAPTGTGTPSGGSGTCAVHDPNTWHGAVGPNGCTYGHEHGDAPPSWVTSLAFNGPFNTSAIENAQGPSDAMPTMPGKHPAMKGALGPVGTGSGGGQFYLRYHGASNVLDRMSQFHSFEIWYRDASGGVTHYSGWTNSGVPSRIGPGTQGAGGRRDHCSAEIDVRPEVEVLLSMAAYLSCNNNEHWYDYPLNNEALPGASMVEFPTISFMIDTTTIMFPTEYQNTSMTTWIRTGSKGTGRNTAVTWGLRNGDPVRPPVGTPFYTTQFGQLVSGPSDPICSGNTTFPARPLGNPNPFDQDTTAKNVCLQQYISPTAPYFIEQTFDREYPSQGVVLPN
jgi:hypothetical protein